MAAAIRTALAIVLVAGCATPPPPTEPARPIPAEPAPSANDEVVERLAPVAPVELVAASPDPTCSSDHLCNGESCCTKLDIPGGSYLDKKAGKVDVGAFRLDKYELTVGRVRAWLEAGRPVPADGAVIGADSTGKPVTWSGAWRVQKAEQLQGWERYDTWSAGDPSLPKNFIDWYTSAAVCAHAGGRLPTDAEWRYAAVGGEENRPFPWGADAETPDRAVFNCSGDGDPSCSLADILPVGSRPLGAGRWGHLDLAGSMFEWTLDAGGSKDAVSRGGGFCYIGGVDRRAKKTETSVNVRRDAPSTTSHMVGARCAFDVPGGGVSHALASR